jgi:hypothetical protein
LINRQNGAVVTHGPGTRSGFALADPPTGVTAAAQSGHFASGGMVTSGVTAAGTGRILGMTGSATPNVTVTPSNSSVVTPGASVRTSDGRTFTRTFTPSAPRTSSGAFSGRMASTPSAARWTVTTPSSRIISGTRSSSGSFHSSGGGSFHSSGGGSFRGGGGGGRR